MRIPDPKSVERLGDSVISGLGTAVPSNIADLSAYKDAKIDELDADGVSYFVLRKPLRQFGDVPLTIGIYRAAAEVDAPMRLLINSGVIGLGFLVFSLIGAAWLSYSIAGPIRRVTEGVTKIGQLSLPRNAQRSSRPRHRRGNLHSDNRR